MWGRGPRPGAYSNPGGAGGRRGLPIHTAVRTPTTGGEPWARDGHSRKGEAAHHGYSRSIVGVEPQRPLSAGDGCPNLTRAPQRSSASLRCLQRSCKHLRHTFGEEHVSRGPGAKDLSERKPGSSAVAVVGDAPMKAGLAASQPAAAIPAPFGSRTSGSSRCGSDPSDRSLSSSGAVSSRRFALPASSAMQKPAYYGASWRVLAHCQEPGRVDRPWG